MSNPFQKAFSQSLKTAAKVMGEPWKFNSAEYAAVSIEEVSAATSVVPGGKLAELSTNLTVLEAVFTASGVAWGSLIEVPSRTEPGGWKKVRVNEIVHSRDGSVTLSCGAAGVKLNF